MVARPPAAFRASRLSLIAAMACLWPAAAARAQQAAAVKPYVFDRAVALCIGIEKYAVVGEAPLAEADARATGATLRDLYGFTPDFSLIGEDASKANITAALARYGSLLGERDILIVYFAGHGQVINLPGAPGRPAAREGFLIPHEARLDLKDHRDPEAWRREAIAMRDLLQEIEAMKARHVLLIVDACFSGFMTQRGSLKARYDLTYLMRNPSRAVLAATTENQLATPDRARGHGHFTAALLDELNNWARKKEAASLTDVFEGVRTQVSRATRAAMIPQMNPRVGAGRGEGEFVFVPKSVRKADVDFVVRLALAEGEADGRGHLLTNVLQRALDRENLKATDREVYEAFEAIDYRFGTAAAEQEEYWRGRRERYITAATAGDVLSMAALHYCESKGLGTEKDDDKAYRWARLAYESGLPAGKHVLGRCLLNGIGTAKNEEAGWKLIGEAADAGFAVSQVSIADRLLREMGQEPGDRVSAVGRARELCEKAADAGLAKAKEQLAMLYSFNGGLPGIPRDINKAVALLESAADANLASSKFELGGILLGRLPGAPRDLPRAKELFAQAARAGLARAQHGLGLEYDQQEGMPLALGLKRDRAQARRWFELAAAQDFAPSLVELCRKYAAGDGVAIDMGKARQYCERAAGLNEPEAFVIQGSWYADGKVYKQDDVRAMDLFRRAAAMGHPKGYRMVGWMYDNARGVPLNGHPQDAMIPYFKYHALHWHVQAVRLGEDPESKKALEAFQREVVGERNLARIGIAYDRLDVPWPSRILREFRKAYPESAKEYDRMFEGRPVPAPAAARAPEAPPRGRPADAPPETVRTGDTRLVIVEGEGATAEEALDGSLREAVRQTIGGLIDAEAEAKHRDAIAAGLLTRAGELVAAHRGHRVDSGAGRQRFRTLAVVKRGEVIAKLKEANVPLRPRDEGLFASDLEEREGVKQNAALIAKALAGRLAGCIEAEMVGKPKLEREDGGQAKVRVSIRYRMNRDAYASLADWLDIILGHGSRSRHGFSLRLKKEGKYFRPEYPPDLAEARGRIDPFSFDAYMPDAPRSVKYDEEMGQPVYFGRGVRRGDDESVLESRWSYIILPRPAIDALERAGKTALNVSLSFRGPDGNEVAGHAERVEEKARFLGQMCTSYVPGDPLARGYDLCILPFFTDNVFYQYPEVIQEVEATIPADKLRLVREIKARVIEP